MALTKISASVIAANAIVAAGVAENSISTSEIATDGVGTLQISDGAVTSGKLETNVDIAGTLDVTGVLTADSNVVIAGNLTVNGATVTNSSTNTTIADALIELGTGTTGSPANDAGIVIERGDSDNAFIGWDESADTFILGTGSFTGASTGNLTISTAPLSVGTLTASGITFPTSDGSSGQVLKTDGSGSLTFDTQTAVVDNFTATGDGSTTDFDTGINPGDEVNTWVFIDGVYQQKGEYSYSGSTISFSTAPDSGATIDVTTGTVGGFASADSVLGVYETTTTNTDTYTTGISASNENNTWVFVGGVYQPKDSYTFSSGTLTFDANTPTGQKLSVTATKSLSAGSVETNSITANAVTSAKIASNSILSRHIANNSIVGADISATTQITASTFTGALTGDVTGNVVGNLTGTIQTAAQTNITSVGTLTGLTTTGNVGINTSNPNASYLQEIAIGTSGLGGLYISSPNNASVVDDHINITASRGATSAYNFLNFTNSAGTMFKVQGDGNVGIGEGSPVAKVHIQGSGTSGQVTSSLILENSSSGTAGLQITGAAGSSHLDFMYGGGPSTGTNTLTTGMTMTLEGSGAGRVGIGTETPAEMLNIETDSGSPAVLVKANGQGGSTSITCSLILSNGSLSSNAYAPAVYSYRTADYSVTALRSSGLKFQTTNSNAAVTAMTIDNDGYVGIGTETPDAILEVARTYSFNERAMIISNGTQDLGAYYDDVVINSDDVPTIRLTETQTGQQMTLSVGNENSNTAIIGATGQLKFATNNANDTAGYIDTNARMIIDTAGHVTKPYQPSFSTSGTSYSQSAGAYSRINPATEVHDNGNNYSNGTFTAPVDGTYQFGFWGLLYPHYNTEIHTMRYFKNGSALPAGTEVQGSGGTGAHQQVAGTMILVLSTNDTVDLRLLIGASSSYKAYSGQWNMWGVLLH